MHGLVEATKRAFRVRDRVITDPDRLPHPPERYLDRAFLDAEAAQDRSPQGRRRGRRRTGEGDTIWMGAADASGLVVSYIQSLYWEFGSGVRAAAHRRADAEPRRELLARPRRAQRARAGAAAVPHPQPGARGARATAGSWPTAPWAATASRRPRRRCSPATSLFRQPLDRAIDAPRWLLGRTWGSAHTNLRLEAPLRRQPDRPAAVGRPRRRACWRSPIPTLMGHAGAVVLHPDGTLEGAHDPRADGGAAGHKVRVICSVGAPSRLHSAALRAMVRRPQLGEQTHDSSLRSPPLPRSRA